MLKLRIVTALLLLPLVIAAVVFLDTQVFAALMALILAQAAWEWSAISRIQGPGRRILYVGLFLLILVLVYLFRSQALLLSLLGTSMLFWLAALWLIIVYQKKDAGDFIIPLPFPLVGFLVMVPPWLSVVVLHASEPDGVKSVLFLMVLIWSADISAYFTGRRWGKNKLCSRVSPGKSWEGVYGAMLAACILALLAAMAMGLPPLKMLFFTLVCLLTVMASVLGDLLESLMKRLNNMKDSGTLLPGHGGVLDRIDSLTAALPVYAGLVWLWDELA